MGFRTTLILLVLAVAFGAGAYYLWDDPAKVDPKKPSEAPKQSLEVPILRHEEALRLSGFRVLATPEGQSPELILEKNDKGRLMLTDPIQDVASAAFVNDLMRIIVNTSLREHFSKGELADRPELWEQTGLTKPTRRLTLTWPGGERRIVSVGGKTPTGSGLFVKMNDIVYTTSNIGLDSMLQAAPEFIRERRLFRQPRVFKVVMERNVPHHEGSGKHVLEVSVKDGKILQPVRTSTDPQALLNFMNAMAGLEVHKFLDGDIPDVVQGEPDLVIKMEGTDGTDEVHIFEQLLSGGVTAQEYLAHDLRRKQVCVLKRNSGLTALNMRAMQLRARLVMPITVDKIQRIELTPGKAAQAAGARQIVMTRGMLGRLRMSRPIESSLGGTPLGRMEDGLRNLAAQSFIDPTKDGLLDLAKYGLGENALVVRVRSKENREIELRIGKDEGSFALLKRSDEPYAVRVLKEHVDKLRLRWVDLLDLNKVVQFTGEPKRLEVRLPGDKEPRFSYHKLGTKWLRTDKAKDEPSDEAVEEFMETIDGVRASKAWELDETMGQPVRLAFYKSSSPTDGAGSYELFRRAGKVFIRARKVPVVFELRRSGLKKLIDTWK